MHAGVEDKEMKAEEGGQLEELAEREERAQSRER